MECQLQSKLVYEISTAIEVSRWNVDRRQFRDMKINKGRSRSMKFQLRSILLYAKSTAVEVCLWNFDCSRSRSINHV